MKALHFHHIDALDKELSISSWQTFPSRQALCAEAAKCALLCANCHAEVHDGMATVPKGAQRFDAVLFAREHAEAVRFRRSLGQKRRAEKTRWRGDWTSVDVVSLRHSGMTWAAIGRLAGVTEVAALRRYRKLKKNLA
jgi:hypothetical protein